jgi:hypothetical protein
VPDNEYTFMELARAVLQQAVEDMLYGPRGESARAREWLLGEGCEYWCNKAGINYRVVVEEIRRYLGE